MRKREYNIHRENRYYSEPLESVATEDSIPVIDVEHKNVMLAKVSGSASVNVRKDPSIDSDIITTLSRGTDVYIFIGEDSGDFYKVFVNDEEGYILKKYLRGDTDE